MRIAGSVLLWVGWVSSAVFFSMADAQAGCDKAKALYEKAVGLTGHSEMKRRAALLEEAAGQCRNVYIFHQLGMTHEAVGDLDAARETYIEARKMTDDPKLRAEIFARLGIVSEKNGQMESALSYYKISYGNHPFPKVRGRIREITRKRMKRGMKSADIREAFRQKRVVRKLFSVEPSIDIYINFERNADTLNEAGKRQADDLGEALKDPVFSGKTITLIGHTCSKGSEDYNMRLSHRRAEAVYRYLHKRHSIPYSRMQKEGRGERALLFPAEQNELERKLNRRVEVVIR